MRASKEYLKSLVPDGLPNGKELLEEGRAFAPSIQAGRSGLVKNSLSDNYLEIFQKQALSKEIFWISQIGLPTVQESVE